MKHFGLQTGRKVDKFAAVKHETRETGCPILPDALSHMELRVIVPELHRLRYAHDIRVRCGRGDVLNPGEPLTYDYYRKNRT